MPDSHADSARPGTTIVPPAATRARGLLEGGLIAAGLLFTAGFLLAWLVLPSWIHFDVVITSSGYLLKPGESFLASFPEHVFNLRITEGGFYRPRFMSFLIEYIDLNLARRLYHAFPQLGVKLPSYALSIIATVAAFVWLWRSLAPGSGYGLALVAGASLLYCDVYMNTSFMVLRGGKFLNSAAGLLCITVFLRYRLRVFSLRQAWSSIAIACGLFLLMAMDEQIAAIVGFTAGVAVVIALMRWRLSQAAVMFVLGGLFYALYYLWWGRWLFARYTPGGINEAAHYHQFSDVMRIRWTSVSQALEMLAANMTALGIASFILLAVHLVSLARIAARRDERFQNLFICAAYTLFPIVLTTIIVTSHGDIYLMKTLWTLFYLALPVHVLIAAAAMSAALAQFRTDYVRIALAVAFVSICATGAWKLKSLYTVSCGETVQVITPMPNWQSYGCGTNPVFP